MSAAAQVDLDSLAAQHGGQAFSGDDLDSLAKLHGGVEASTPKPSIASDALKYSPIGMVKGLADMIGAAMSGKNPLAGMPQANADLLTKAKQSFDQGHYADAAAPFANYILPGGSAFEDIQNDIRDGNYGHAAAKFTGLASSVAAGAVDPAAVAKVPTYPEPEWSPACFSNGPARDR
jgi:hypothetical protein